MAQETGTGPHPSPAGTEPSISSGEPSAGKGAPLPGDRPIAALSPSQTRGVPYGKLIRWGWYVVSVALGWFIANTFLTILVEVLTQYNVQVLATVVSGLTASGGAGPGAATGSHSTGFLSHLLPTSVRTAAILFAALSLLIIFLRLMDRFLSAWTDNTMLGRLQRRLHDKLIRLGPSYHKAHNLGETLMIVTQFSGGTQIMLRDLISSPVVYGISLVTALVFLVNNMGIVGDTPLWIRLTLLTALFILPIGGWWFSSKVRTAFQRVRDSQSALADEFTNSASLPLEVQLMGAEQQRSKAFGQRVRVHIRNKVMAALRSEVANQFQTTTPLVLQTVFLIYGVFFALKSSNPAAPGAILAIFYFVPQVVGPLQNIIQFVTGLNTAWPQVEKVVEILEASPEIEDAPHAVELSPEDRSLTFEAVTFSYRPQGPKLLDHLNHSFDTGKATAIVARSGGGKSTLLNLVARLYDPQEGHIRIGDKDIREVKLRSLRKQVVRVSQFPLFIVDTIRANFQLAKADATDGELQDTCRKTGLWEILEKVTAHGQNPLDYVLPKTDGLSGGERRLLAVTRALLLKPSIMLLDEPTTGVDAIARQMLARVLREACAGLTVLLVDHDMSFVSGFADRICCLESGRFVDVGTPEELSARPGLFQQLLKAPEKRRPPGEPPPDRPVTGAP